MIFKIQSQTFPDTVGQDIKRLSKYFNMLYVGNILYAAKRQYTVGKSPLDLLKPRKNYFVVEVTNKNLAQEPQEVKDWCTQRLTSLEAEKFEAENQDRLELSSKQIDFFENELKKALENSEKGDEDICQMN